MHSDRVTAANGTTINIAGKRRFLIKLNEVQFEAEMLVSFDIEEAMIGANFMMAHDTCWQVNTGFICIDGHELRLHSRQSGGWCRRIYCQQTTIIPAHTQHDIAAQMPLRNVNDSGNSILIETAQLRPGVVLASSVVPGDDTSVRVRVCNTNSHAVTLKQGTPLGVADKTAVIDVTHHDSGEREQKVEEIVTKLCSSLPESLTTRQKTDIRSLLMKYEQILSVDEFDLGYSDILKHKIDTGDSRPVREALRRHPQAHLQFIDDHVEKMQQAGVIEPARSEWGSNVCLAKKKDGSLRFAIDFRRVNRLTRLDSYPLPRIDNCLDSLSGSCWFSTIDLRSGFWQVAQDPVDADKTTFITRQGSFRFRVLPFG